MYWSINNMVDSLFSSTYCLRFDISCIFHSWLYLDHFWFSIGWFGQVTAVWLYLCRFAWGFYGLETVLFLLNLAVKEVSNVGDLPPPWKWEGWQEEAERGAGCQCGGGVAKLDATLNARLGTFWNGYSAARASVSAQTPSCSKVPKRTTFQLAWYDR